MRNLAKHLKSNSYPLATIGLFFALIPIFFYFNLPFADILTRIFAISIYALSFDLLLGYTGLLNFGQSLFFGMGAYITAYTLNWTEFNFMVALLFSLLVGAILGVILSLIVRRSFKGVPFTFFSLAFVMIILSMFQKRIFRPVSGGEGGILVPLPGILKSIWAIRVFEYGFLGLLAIGLLVAIYKNTRNFSLLQQVPTMLVSSGIIGGIFYFATEHLSYLESAASFERLTANRYYLTLSFLVAIYFLIRRVVSSPVGKVWQSIRENETRTEVIGYNTFNYKLLALAVSGSIAGLAGGLYAPYLLTVSAGNVFDPFITIRALIFAVLGGLGTLKGAILGAGIILLLEHFLNPLIGGWTSILIGIIFIFVVFSMPRGIVGELTVTGGKSFREMVREMVS
ncbi:branched-chain amino acid ABC transporter permease [Candidatus Bipolaricaulota bacterium]|nr:branched-chain amino acid ABC transporter permease [Candidatus Bipolaricaulota bacterium]